MPVLLLPVLEARSTPAARSTRLKFWKVMVPLEMSPLISSVSLVPVPPPPKVRTAEPVIAPSSCKVPEPSLSLSAVKV